jgi:hypothetical protein
MVIDQLKDLAVINGLGIKKFQVWGGHRGGESNLAQLEREEEEGFDWQERKSNGSGGVR